MHKIVNGERVELSQEEEEKLKSEWEINKLKQESLKQEAELKKQKRNDATKKLQEKLEMTAEELDILFGFSK